MTRYEQLEILEKDAKGKAEKLKDGNLKQFYENAAVGFAQKRAKLTIEEAEKTV